MTTTTTDKVEVKYIGRQNGFDGEYFSLYNICAPESPFHNSTIMISGDRDDNAALIKAKDKIISEKKS
jgi:hypothetical protein